MLPFAAMAIASVSEAEPILPPSATTIAVCVVVPPEVCTVPVSLGNVIVLSAVGSTTVNVVSKPSSVAPSNIIVPSSFTSNVVAFVVVVFKVV